MWHERNIYVVVLETPATRALKELHNAVSDAFLAGCVSVAVSRDRKDLMHLLRSSAKEASKHGIADSRGKTGTWARSTQ